MSAICGEDGYWNAETDAICQVETEFVRLIHCAMFSQNTHYHISCHVKVLQLILILYFIVLQDDLSVAQISVTKIRITLLQRRTYPPGELQYIFNLNGECRFSQSISFTFYDSNSEKGEVHFVKAIPPGYNYTLRVSMRVYVDLIISFSSNVQSWFDLFQAQSRVDSRISDIQAEGIVEFYMKTGEPSLIEGYEWLDTRPRTSLVGVDISLAISFWYVMFTAGN